MKNKKAILYSVSISVILHLLFFFSSAGITIPGIYTMLSRTKRLFDIKILGREMSQEKPVRKRGVTYVQTLKFRSPEYSESIKSFMAEEEELEKPSFVPKDKEEIKDPVALSKKEELKDILESEKEYQKLSKGLPRDTRKELVEVADLTDQDALVKPEDLVDETELPSDFIEKMPGFTPKKTGGLLDSAKQKIMSKVGKGYAPAIKRKGDFEDIRGYLFCELSKYEDPQDGQKYYRISIRTGPDSANLSTMPKEVVFLVDCSLSIQTERLEEFKKGLHYCLSHLNPDDYFNIIAFKEDIIPLSPTSLKPSEANIKNALKFVGRLVAGEGTDAYNALNESMRIKETITPSYIVIFSDGRPTYGVTDSRRIISEISKINDGRRPIFAFSGGMRVNRYFLDFISYKNRGWTEYASRTHLIDRHMANMYDKIRDPILLKLRYNVSGLDGKEIFPKMLPDFYRNAEFTLYGKYTDEDEFSIQLLGELDDEINEFIIIGSLNETATGDKDIARNWAFNKIYHLIGLLEYGRENEEVINEINLLCKKFGIVTPYSQEIKKK